ncbi:gamma-glutamylcyclotransferase family protein [Aquisalimonas asiatica]|uniref:AIG2-like family protein n=1 Tax=Aquisalimonas asiatica TaxID=406100 RepID=A0A1H8TXN9_9GAMM|nr:gamma-glutamylcyclotransferase family protein [Aquisalimonas asiatica]SEO95667.1 AIG2-like family protein [Aquisalimonas asiatica]
MADWRHYFAYGSNMLPARLLERTPSAHWLGVGRLPGYRLHFNHVSRADGTAKCNIERCDAADAAVWGVVYAVHREEQPVLDRAEDLGTGYLIEPRLVHCQGGWQETFCYIAVPGTTDPAARPFRWYRDIVLAGARNHAFPAAYIDRIARERAVEDPNPRRAAHHQYLIDMSPD